MAADGSDEVLVAQAHEANAAFYAAFEARDLDAMSDLWEHSDRVMCSHPGWRTLHGWARVGGSWAQLLANAEHLQFIVTEVRVQILGDVAWVSCDENLLQSGSTAVVSALNLFVRTDGRWKLVAHHAAPVA